MPYRKDGQIDSRLLPVIKYAALGRQGADGLAEHAIFGESGPPAINIDIGLTKRRRLEIEIHELLHLIQPGLTEDAVVRTSRYISRALWKIGYRVDD